GELLGVVGAERARLLALPELLEALALGLQLGPVGRPLVAGLGRQRGPLVGGELVRGGGVGCLPPGGLRGGGPGGRRRSRRRGRGRSRRRRGRGPRPAGRGEGRGWARAL